MVTEREPQTIPDDPERIVKKVQERYGRIAEGVESGCCGPGAGTCSPAPGDAALAVGYKPQELAVLPEGANLGLGCGAPIEALELQAGETALDLGSGAGVDVLLAARRVGPTGRVIGVDMTPSMLDKARANAAAAGATQVEFRAGRLEALPVEDASVDAVTSNCVINLVPDKEKVFREIARVLRPRGRVVISDIVLNGKLPEVLEKDLLAYVGCVAGAALRETYFGQVRAAGFSNIEILKDVDYLAGAGYTFSDDLRQRMARAGVRDEDIAGRVRSITFRAVKPAI